MDAQQAARNLEVIRTLMERSIQYELLTARAGLAAGSLALLGGCAFFWLDAAQAGSFAAVWAAVFAGSVLAACCTTIMRARELEEQVWSRQARAVLLALAPSLFAAAVLTLFFFGRGEHLWLPGVWMLCYGQGALATAAYAPSPIRHFGLGMLLAGAATLVLGPPWAAASMTLVFGLGHVGLGLALLMIERRRAALRLYRSVA
jgi:hypothetical protein